MEFCGVIGDSKSRRNFLITQTLRQHFEDLRFTRRQRLDESIVPRVRQYRRGILDGHHREACGRGVNSRNNLRWRGILRQYSAHTAAKQFRRPSLPRIVRKQHHGRRRFFARPVRQRVGDHNFRRGLLRHHFEIGLRPQHRLETGPSHRRRGGDVDADHAAAVLGAPSCTATSREALLPRKNLSTSTRPAAASIASLRSSKEPNAVPFAAIRMSPGSSDAAAAALSRSISSTIRPTFLSHVRTGLTVTPSDTPAPYFKNDATVLLGTASARPPATIIVLSPTTRPCASASGPPELPGTSPTSACTQVRLPSPRSGPMECTTPVVQRADKSKRVENRPAILRK